MTQGTGAAASRLCLAAIAVFLLLPSLIIVTAWAAWQGNFVVPVAIAWLVQGIGHLVYHVGHLTGIDGADRIGLIGSLTAVPVLAAIALVADVQDRRRLIT